MDQPHSNPTLIRGPLTIGHIATVALLLWVVFAATSRFQRTRDVPFDRDMWIQSSRPKDRTTRFSMRNDVVARLNAEKPALGELFQMLGSTDGWPREKSDPMSSGGMIRYPLGTHPNGFFSLAHGWLLDVYVADGRVSEARLHRD